MSDTKERLPMSAFVFAREMAEEPTPEWTEDHQAEYERQLKRLDVTTAVFDHDTTWR